MSLGLAAAAAALLLAAMIVADFYVPVLPSATLIAAIAGFVAGDVLLIAALVAWAALASWLGDLLGYRVLRRARARMRTPTGPAEAVRLELRLRAALRRRPRATTVLARFLPAGRTVLAWTAVATPDYRHASMSALAAAVWAVGMVGTGLLAGGVFGAGPLSAVAAAVVVAFAGALTGHRCRGVRTGRRRLEGTIGRIGGRA